MANNMEDAAIELSKESGIGLDKVNAAIDVANEAAAKAVYNNEENKQDLIKDTGIDLGEFLSQRQGLIYNDPGVTEAPIENPKYPHNVLEGFGWGVLMDLRVRLAIDFMKSSPVFHGLAAHTSTAEGLKVLPATIASLALHMADQILEMGRAEGLVEDLPDDAEIGNQLRLQAKRTATFNVLQQLEGNKAAQAEQGTVIPMAPGAIPPHGRHS